MKPVPLRVVERGLALLEPSVLFGAVVENEIEAGKGEECISFRKRKQKEEEIEEEGRVDSTHIIFIPLALAAARRFSRS